MPATAQKPKRLIDVREAVQKSRRYAIELFPGLKAEDVSLEEVQLSADDKFWSITLGFPETIRGSKNSYSNLRAMFVPNTIFKQFKVRRIDGEVLSMEIWKPS